MRHAPTARRAEPGADHGAPREGRVIGSTTARCP